MERCEYCGTPFIKGESCDIGVGFMQVTADEPNCECYETDVCLDCGLVSNNGELDRHDCGGRDE